MDRAKKEALVESLRRTFSDTTLVVVTHYRGLNAAEIGKLRRGMREAGAEFRVTKNRLARLALVGTPYETIADLFDGPTAIAYSDDPVAAAKVAVDFAKTNDKLVVVGGGLGEMPLSEAEVKALATLPSLDELRGQLVGMLQTPATRVASVLQAPAGQLARVFGAYGSTDEAA